MLRLLYCNHRAYRRIMLPPMYCSCPYQHCRTGILSKYYTSCLYQLHIRLRTRRMSTADFPHILRNDRRTCFVPSYQNCIPHMLRRPSFASFDCHSSPLDYRPTRYCYRLRHFDLQMLRLRPSHFRSRSSVRTCSLETHRENRLSEIVRRKPPRSPTGFQWLYSDRRNFR